MTLHRAHKDGIPTAARQQADSAIAEHVIDPPKGSPLHLLDKRPTQTDDSV
jgi:hypothetical protein